MDLTLFWFNPACSLASHLALEGSGLSYEHRETTAPTNKDALLRINPRGTVPTLMVDEQVLTENVAILTFIADLAPDRQLLPADPVQRAQCIAFLSWISNTAHIHYRQTMRPERFAQDVNAHEAIRATGRIAFQRDLIEIEKQIGSVPWLFGDRFTVADAYVAAIFQWAVHGGNDLSRLPALRAQMTRLLAQPAVNAVVRRERSILSTFCP